jgi:hypothetical protein
MTYIALPETHDPKTGAAISYAILKQEEGGQRVPVSFLRQADCPVPLAKLAENLASITNGNDPLHMIDSDHRMYFQDIDGGFHLRFRRNDDHGGVTHVGATMTSMGRKMGMRDCIAARKLCRTVVCPEPRNDHTPKRPSQKI